MYRDISEQVYVMCLYTMSICIYSKGYVSVQVNDVKIVNDK